MVPLTVGGVSWLVRLGADPFQATIALLVHVFFAHQVKSGRYRALCPRRPETLNNITVTRGKYRILYHIIVRADDCITPVISRCSNLTMQVVFSLGDFGGPLTVFIC